MANKVLIEITETTLHSITIDLDRYSDEVREAYEEQDADFFSDFIEKADQSETTFEWG